MWIKLREWESLRQPSPIRSMIDQKQLTNVKYLNYSGSMITNDAKRTREIKSRIAMAKAAFNRKTYHQQTGLTLKNKLVNFYIWSLAMYGAENWQLRKVDQKHLEMFDTWSCRRTEKISWTDQMRNQETLHRVKKAEYPTYDKKKKP